MFNLKGGQGKSSIALNLALSMNFDIISNDAISKLESVLSEDNFLSIKKDRDFPDVTEDLNIIYDLGGWLDTRVLKPLKEADLVIIPMINSEINNEVSINSINQVKNINNNIIIIANRCKKNDYFIINELVNKYFPDNKFPIFEIMDTTAFEQMVVKRMSIQKIADLDPLLKHNYKKINEQFNNIINFIRNFDV